MRGQPDSLSLGQSAPLFAAKLPNGETFHLEKCRGNFVLLVFYPGDFTPICTSQLCLLRDCWEEIQSAGILVVGLNPAPHALHKIFSGITRLPFPLLSDASGSIAQSYGCRGKFGSNVRTVFLLDREGIVAKIWRGKPAVAEILEQVRQLENRL